MKALGVLAAILFIAAVVMAQLACPVHSCHGSNIDAWLAAAAFAPVGIPCLVWVVYNLFKNFNRR